MSPLPKTPCAQPSRSMSAAFEVYEELPETVPLDFTEDDVTWVASKLSGAAGALGAEVMELRNSLLHFVCTSEEFRFFVTSLADWMAKSSPPWAAYCALMVCCLVALDKRPGVRPVGIGEMLRRALAKLVMRAAGEQVKTLCGNLQLCAGLEDGIEGGNHAVGQSRVDRVLSRRGEMAEETEEEGEEPEEGGDPEEEGTELVAGLINLTIETEGTEEEAEDGLAVYLEMEEDEEEDGLAVERKSSSSRPAVPHSA